MNHMHSISLVLMVVLAVGGCAVAHTPETKQSPDVSTAAQVFSLVPSSVVTGASDFTLNVIGANFRADAVVLWNGAAHATTFLSGTQLAAKIATGDVAGPGTAQVAVSSARSNAPPSNAVAFSIRPPSPLQISTGVLPEATVQAPYRAALASDGGTAPFTWTAASGQLPPGLTLNGGNGVVSGTPTQVGGFSFTVQVADSSSPRQTATRGLQISVTGASPLQIATIGLPGGQVGTSYSAGLATTGGVPPYSWSVVAGSLPPGLTLGATTGVMSGTLTRGGQYSFTVQVRDSAAWPQTAAAALAVNVAPSTPDPPGGLKIMTWGDDTPEWSRRLNLAGIRYGCSESPAGCVYEANLKARVQGVDSISIAITGAGDRPSPSDLASLALQYSALSVSNPVVHEITIDDFAEVVLYYWYCDPIQEPSYCPPNAPRMSSAAVHAALQDLIDKTKHHNPNLKLGVTMYENEIRDPSNWRVDDASFPPDIRARIDSVYLYMNYRRSFLTYEDDVREAKRMFPNARILAGSYAYDRVDFTICSLPPRGEEQPPPGQPDPRRCTSQQELDYYRASIETQARLMRSGIVDGIEFYPADFGNEENIYGIYDLVCNETRRQECINNTRAMRQAALAILDIPAPSF